MRDLTKKRLGEFGKELEAMQAAFFANVDKLAEEARTQILPYFKERGLDFRAGNNDWQISRPSADAAPHFRLEDLVDDELPKNIRDLLMLEVAYADHLGFYIRDIKRGVVAMGRDLRLFPIDKLSHGTMHVRETPIDCLICGGRRAVAPCVSSRGPSDNRS